MTISLLGLLALFCSVTGIALAHWDQGGWIVVGFSVTALASLQASYLATTILLWLR